MTACTDDWLMLEGLSFLIRFLAHHKSGSPVLLSLRQVELAFKQYGG